MLIETSSAAARPSRLQLPQLTSVTRATHAADPISLFARAEAETRALWLRPATGEAMLGIGSAYDFTGSGAERFSQVATAWRELLADAVIEGDTEIGPRLIGGFAFDSRRERAGLWEGFPDARLVLPKRVLTMSGEQAWLTTNVVVEPHGRPATQRRGAEVRPRKPESGLSADEWRTLVADVARAIGDSRGGLRKVVLARAHEVRTGRTLEAILRRLSAEYPSCTIFAIAVAIANRETCFLGATPERLISLRDGVATTMALAGSAPRGTSQAEDARIAERLLGDPKERSEHAMVVDALRDGFGQACTHVIADTEPRLEKLSNVQHLLTAVRGELEAGHSVLDLVERLHPTPAVGGFPRDVALEVIRAREELDRGWYAGPMGWVDERGDGEFVVGLRSALVDGHTATLFSGCGIVAESDPAAEYAEWGWKLRPMLTALGPTD